MQLHREDELKKLFFPIDSASGLKYVFHFPDSLHGAFHFSQLVLWAIDSFILVGSTEMGTTKLRYRSKWETHSKTK